jgi:hypothetical protein
MIQAAIAGAVVWYGSPDESTHYFGAMNDKLARLQGCAGNRLMVMGGSNVAFGIHSQELQEQTGLETVNLGMHVSLGLDYAIQCAAWHVRSGDVVLMVPEYELLISELQEGDAKIINQLLTHCPSATRYFDTSQHRGWKQFLDQDALCQAHQWVARACRRIRKSDSSDRIYQRASFNELGDVVAHYGRTGEHEVSKSLPEINAERLDQAIEKLNRLAAICRQRGAAVYLAFPPLPQRTYARSAEAVRRVQASLQARLEMAILNRPEESVFASDQFFDTGDHLNQRAGRQRTQAIATALLRQRRGVRVASGSTDAGAIQRPAADKVPTRR